jgi:hypothetical protein
MFSKTVGEENHLKNKKTNSSAKHHRAFFLIEKKEVVNYFSKLLN